MLPSKKYDPVFYQNVLRDEVLLYGTKHFARMQLRKQGSTSLCLVRSSNRMRMNFPEGNEAIQHEMDHFAGRLV